MFFQFGDRKLESIFGITGDYGANWDRFSQKNDLVSIIWNQNDKPVAVEIDAVPMAIKPNQLVTLTYLQKVSFESKAAPLTGFVFNREFYCLLDHDEEVSCNGILFFGSQDLPFVALNKKEKASFELLLEVFKEEFQTSDNIQGEMLQMLLKRLIIKLVRLAKDQVVVKNLNNTQVDIIRQYNVLVDTHYREKRQVKDYADLLHKSPKTLSNLFSIYGHRTPRQIIHKRVVLEAKRLLRYTDMNAKEVAYDLGFDDPSHFTHYFKKVAGTTPNQFKIAKLA